MIVGLVGKKRSGKDTFAKTLVEERGFTRFAFADPLREALLHTNPLVPAAGSVVVSAATVHGCERLADVVDRIGWEDAKENREVRRLLQEYGVAIREIEPDFWVRTTLDQARRAQGNVVVTDVRFPNEVAGIRALGGTIVQILRPGLESTDTHISETALEGLIPDISVVNRTLDGLACQARNLLL